MLAYLNLCSQVTIGNVWLNHVSSVEINESILTTSNTAKITLAKNYAKLRGENILSQFKVGDKVVIRLGYNDKLMPEFVGYVSEIESDIPLIVYCEDETWNLRQSSYNEAWRAVTLKEVLALIIPPHIQVECPDMQLGKFLIDNESAFHVLERIQKEYGLYSRLQNGVLRLELAYVFGDGVKDTHDYVIGKNVKKNELKYKRKEDFKLRITVTGRPQRGNERIEVTVGSKDQAAQELNVKFAGITDKAELTRIADSLYTKKVYDGYTGAITGFGMPQTHAGDALKIADAREPQRAGRYLIEKTTITYGVNGFQRKNDLCIRLSDEKEPENPD